MSSNFTLIVIVIVAFSVIHFLEVTSFLARLAGVISQNSALAYSTQNAVFMLTRFFSMMMLPILGLIVDLRISKSYYLLMCSTAFFAAFLSSLLAFSLRSRCVSAFEEVISKVKSGKNLSRQLITVPSMLFKGKKEKIKIPSLRTCFSDKIFLYGAIVFSIYAISIFLAFFFSLLIPEYRTSISQLSGILNAFATVLLTFYLEPKISVSIDKNENPNELLLKLVMGRIFGLGILTQCVLLVLTLIVYK